MKGIAITIFCVIIGIILIGVLAMAVILYDYEHESERCKNCMYCDDVLHHCWPKGEYVGREEKACQFFHKREKL